MAFTAKFQVQQVTRADVVVRKTNEQTGAIELATEQIRSVTLAPVNGEPNDSLWAGAPNGKIELHLLLRDAGAYFELDADYELVLTRTS